MSMRATTVPWWEPDLRGRRWRCSGRNPSSVFGVMTTSGGHPGHSCFPLSFPPQGALQALSLFLWDADHQKCGCFCWSWKVLRGWAGRSFSGAEFWVHRRLHHALHQGHPRHRAPLRVPVQLPVLPHCRDVPPLWDRGVSVAQQLLSPGNLPAYIHWKTSKMLLSLQICVWREAGLSPSVTLFPKLHVDGCWWIYVGFWGMFVWAPWFLFGKAGCSNSEMSGRFGRARRSFLAYFVIFRVAQSKPTWEELQGGFSQLLGMVWSWFAASLFSHPLPHLRDLPGSPWCDRAESDGMGTGAWNIPAFWEQRILMETSALEILTWLQKLRHSSWAQVPPNVSVSSNTGNLLANFSQS